MNFRSVSRLVLFLFLGVQLGASQGFVNLNFENPVLPLNPVYFEVAASNAIPGWTAYVGDVRQTYVVYDTRPLDAAEVTFQGTNSLLTPIQGNYTVWLFGASIYAPQQSAAIGQTGQIPAKARSLIFWGYAGPEHVSFAGQTLALFEIGSSAHYNIYGADISAFAGQVGQLLFTAPPGYADEIDNIQFSPSPIPEPTGSCLFALASFLFGLHRQRKS